MATPSSRSIRIPGSAGAEVLCELREAAAKSAFKIDIVDCFRKTQEILPSRGRHCHRRQGVMAAARRRQRRGRAQSRGGRPRLGDGPLRQNRARAPVRRLELGRGQYRVISAKRPRWLPNRSEKIWPDRKFGFGTLACTRDRYPTPPPRRAPCHLPDHLLRVRFGRARASLFNLQTFGNVYTACRTRPPRCSKSAWRRSKAGARAPLAPPGGRKRPRCSPCASRATESYRVDPVWRHLLAVRG